MDSSSKEKRLAAWVEKSIENEDFSSYELTLVGKPEKGEGYLGEIVFANVRGTTSDNKEKSLDLAIKHGKENDQLNKKNSTLKTAFRREVFVYDKVLPTFKKFQIQKKIPNPFVAVPKCYKAFVVDDLEVLVLENLKKNGYDLHNCRKPLNINHLKAILVEYGKLHALSFAMREQQEEEFNSLMDGNDFFKHVLSKPNDKNIFNTSTGDVMCIFEKRGDLSLAEKLRRLLAKGVQTVLYEFNMEEEPQSVISHGDCWNNNFLFSYKTRGVPQTEIISWVEKCMENENLLNYEIKLTGKTEKGDGYAGEIVFVNVKGTTEDKNDRVLDLVIKHAKNNDHLRESIPVRSIFKAEMNFYDKVFPILREFQRKKNVSDGFESVPKCYLTIMLEKMEVLILENLRTKNYELHDRNFPLNYNHLEVILKEYGKFHALSFAMREQQSDVFNSISDDERVYEEFFKDQSIKNTFHKSNTEVLDILGERGDTTLRNKLEQVLVKNSIDLMLELMAEEEHQTVINHGDSWNNNFMFKYKGTDRTSPSQIRILDWQLSSLRSPVFDLSYLIYANSSQKELDQFEDLLETYYASFSSFLRQLGSNPDELFTYADLRRHWKKYSLYGALFMPTLLKFVLCKKEDAPALEDFKEGQDFSTFMSPDIGDPDAYYERLKAVFTHYFEYTVLM